MALFVRRKRLLDVRAGDLPASLPAVPSYVVPKCFSAEYNEQRAHMKYATRVSVTEEKGIQKDGKNIQSPDPPRLPQEKQHKQLRGAAK